MDCVRAFIIRIPYDATYEFFEFRTDIRECFVRSGFHSKWACAYARELFFSISLIFFFLFSPTYSDSLCNCIFLLYMYNTLLLQVALKTHLFFIVVAVMEFTLKHHFFTFFFFFLPCKTERRNVSRQSLVVTLYFFFSLIYRGL